MRRFMAAALTAVCLAGLAGPASAARPDPDDPAEGCEYQNSPRLDEYCTDINP